MHATMRMSYLPDETICIVCMYCYKKSRGTKPKNERGSTTVGAADRCGFLMGWSGVRYIYIYDSW